MKQILNIKNKYLILFVNMKKCTKQKISWQEYNKYLIESDYIPQEYEFFSQNDIKHLYRIKDLDYDNRINKPED